MKQVVPHEPADSDGKRLSAEAGGSGGWTPGPWEVEDAPRRGAWIKGSTGEWTALACGDTDASAAANARLIAAAPALYEALRALQIQALQSPDLCRTEWGQEALNATRAALALATGASQ